MRRALPAAFVLALVAVASLLVMPRLDEATGRAVSAALEDFRSRAAGSLGLSLSFDSLSPSILRSASFSKLSIGVPGGRSVLSARKVRLRYNILALATGRGSGISGLDLSDVSLDLRLPEDRELLDRLSSLFSGEGGGDAPRLVVTGKNVSASITLAGRGSAAFTARRVAFSTLQSEPTFVLEGRFSLAASAASGLGSISGPLSVSGSLSRDFTKARAALSLAAESPGFSLSTQRFELVYGGSELSLTKVKDRSPLDLMARLSFDGGESSISLKMDGYYPSKSFRLSGSYASFEPWLELPYEGSLVLRAPGTKLSALSYEARLSGFLPPGILPGSKAAARASFSLKGDSRVLSIERLRIERDEDSLSYSGSFRFADLSPDGRLELRLSPMEGFPAVASSFRVFGRGGEYAAFAEELSVGDTRFKDLSLAAGRRGERLDFSISVRPPSSEEPEPQAELPDAGFSGEAGSAQGASLVRCEGSASLGAQPGLELSLELEALDLGPLKGIIASLTGSEEAASLLSSLKLGGSAFATTDFKRLSWTASDLTLVSRYAPGAYALLSLSGTTSSMQVKRALLSFSGSQVEGTGRLDFSDPKGPSFDAELSYQDIPYSLQGRMTREGLFVNGDYGLAVSARAEGASAIVSARASGLPVPFGGGLFLASMDVEGRFASLENWDAELGSLAIIPTGEKMAGLPKVELSGSFAPTKARLGRIRVEDRYSALEGSGTLDYDLSKSPSAKLSANLSALSPKLPAAAANGGAARAPAPATESYRLDLSYAEGRCEGRVDLVASPLARLGKLPISGSVDGRVAISGALSSPALDFSLSLRDGRYGEQSVALSASGAYAAGLVSLRELSAAYQGQTIREGKGSFSLLDAKGEIALRFVGSFGGKELSFSLAAKGASPSGEGGDLARKFSRYSLSGALSSVAYGDSRVEAWPFSLNSSASSVVVVGGAQNEVKLRYFEGGRITANLRPPFPVLADLSGLYDGKKIDLSVQGFECDLKLLSQFLPLNPVQIAAGRAHGGFSAIGLASDPEITGEIDLDGAVVKVPGWIVDDIGPFSAPIVSRGRKFGFSVPRASVGKGAVAIDCGAVFDHWVPSGLAVNVRSLPDSSLRIDTKIMGIRAKGDASLTLKVSLQGDVVAIDTDVLLEKAEVLVSQEVLGGGGGGSSGPPSAFFQVAANVRFGRTVKASFAPMSIPVVSGYADPSSLLSIRYDQAAEDFSVKGSVGLRGGEVFYGQRSFFLKSGKIVFNESSARFEPRATLLAELRERNDDGPVVITLRADNAPLGSFTPVLSSNPALPEAQIMALLGLASSTESGSLDIKKVFIAGTELIPQLNVTRIVEDKLRDFVGLDMLYLRSQVLQQWLVDVVGQSSSSSLGAYFDQSELYAGKYLTDSIFVHGSVSLQESTPLASAEKLIIDSEIGVDLDAPFGRLTWTLAPQDGWNNLRFSDQSLSLSWRLSY